MGNDKKVRSFCGGRVGEGGMLAEKSRVFLTEVGIHPLFLGQIKNAIQEGSRGAGIA